MSRTGASPPLSNIDVQTMVLNSDAPCFVKTITRAMTERNDRLVIPIEFINKHGNMLHSVISLTGPNGCPLRVMLKVRTCAGRDGRLNVSVFMAHGWKYFVTENCLQMGDRIIFQLVARSRFRVLLCAQPHEEAVFGNLISSSKDHESQLDSPSVISEAPPLPEVTSNQTSSLSPSRINLNAVENCLNAEPMQWTYSERAKIKSVEGINPLLLSKDICHNSLGLNSAINLNSRYPQFTKKLTGINVPQKGAGDDLRLELPSHFVRAHGDRFQASVFLLGPGSNFVVVKLSVRVNGNGNRVQFRGGWKEFSIAHGLKVGDVLLFSLIGLSKFVVKVFSLTPQ
uniref:TF-B3 domain-containing protein n=1 Tax=Physcomitrium patens TaxID=3218 RepID=A9SCH8_PHYPA|nr:hypothetical protein PHYPA_022365 [Physcomitrium patens]